ncbi:MAG: DUF192 domain-containing protein [Myxococcota bacterium]
MIRSAPVLAVLVLAGACGDGRPRAVVTSPEGEPRLEVAVEIAETAEARMRGLRGWTALEPDEGLLLVFPTEGEVCLVNEDVPFAIDAVFADASGAVVAIEREVPAGDATPRCHPGTARVLEVAAGVAAPVAPDDLLVVR